MKYIDLHCDTLIVFAGEGGSLYENQMSVDLKRLRKNDCVAQFFAVWLPDEGTRTAMEEAGEASSPETSKTTMGCGEGIGLAETLRRNRFAGLTEGAWDDAYIDRLLDSFERELALHKEEVSLALSAENMEQNAANGRLSAFLTLEDGRAVRGSLDRLKRFYDRGIRLITLTWNHDNCFGRANYRDGVFGSRGSGLTAFGKEAVRFMNELGMLVDVSHLSDEGFFDVAAVSEKPFVASHSNARALAGCSRNMSDEMIRLLALKGGVMGLNFAPGFLSPDFSDPNSRVSHMAAHARHILNCGGEEVLALGTDFDGVSGNLEIDSPDRLFLLWEALSRAGFTERQIELAACKNAARVIRDVLG